MKQHPSGRPIRTDNKRSWHYGPHVEHGFRNWRLNPPPVPRITGATDLHAVGFIDWEARAAADEIESRTKVGADSHGV